MNLDQYVGVRYLNRGRDRRGWDCWGLVLAVYRNEMNIALANLDGYSNSEDGAQVGVVVREESLLNWEKVDFPKRFDVVVFQMLRHPSHVGVMVDNLRFLHSIKGRETCVEYISKAIWENRVEGYYRLKT